MICITEAQLQQQQKTVNKVQYHFKVQTNNKQLSKYR